MLTVLIASASAALYGGADFLGGLSAARWTTLRATATSQASGVPILLVALAVTQAPSIGRTDLAWGAAAGVAGVCGIASYYHALSIGPMGVAAPVAAVISAVIPLGAGLASGEHPGGLAMLGALVGVAAVALVSSASGPHSSTRPRAAVLPALLAGVGFGGFYALLGQVSTDAGLWPLLPERVIAVALVLPLAVWWPSRSDAAPRGLTLGVVAGVTDMCANILFLVAVHRGLLSLVGVIAAMYPATTMVLARWVLSERLARWQLAGVALALVSLALIASA